MMSNKLSPLFNSTSSLLEFQIWSDATSHVIPFKSCAATGKNRFELVTASLNNVLPMRNGSTPRPLLKPPYFPAWWFISEKHVVEDDMLFTKRTCYITNSKANHENISISDKQQLTRMHSSRMCTTNALPCGGLPDRDPTWQRPPDRDSPGQRPLGQRHPPG